MGVLGATRDASSEEEDFFIFFRCNPLKSHDSKKEMKIKERK